MADLRLPPYGAGRKPTKVNIPDDDRISSSHWWFGRVLYLWLGVKKGIICIYCREIISISCVGLCRECFVVCITDNVVS